MAGPGMAHGLRIGTLVEVHGLPESSQAVVAEQLDLDLPINGQLGQLVGISSEENKLDIALINGVTVSLEQQYVRKPQDLKKSGLGGPETSFDLLLGPQTQDHVLAEELAVCMFEKGFCVLKTCQKTKDVQKAVEAVQNLARQGKLGRLPQEVEEGYLGEGGRGKVVWMDPDRPDLVQNDVLDAADRNFSYIATVFQPHSADVLGHLLEERTPALVSLSLDDHEEDEYPHPMADDKTLGDYLGTWRRGLLRAVHFMGPATATVTLETRGGPKAAALPHQLETVAISASANTIVLFRTDCFTFSYTAPAEVLTVMASFLYPAPQFVLTGWDGDMRFLSLVGEGPLPPDGDCINVLNCSTRLPACWDEPEMCNTGLQGGTDAVVEIPFARFDINFYYCPNVDDLLMGPPRTTQKHTSFVDGVELFDNKYFEISANEAMGMDPLQRQVLEVGGANLYMHGITKKISNRTAHHAGCSVGLDKADFPTLGLDTGSSAGNNALAIIANRFSFVFNLKGPNYICDTACSASLTATHLAKLMLLERVWDPLEFHVAIGTHLCLSPMPWIGCSMSHMVSPQGRCFTFDSSANGYLRGEGTSGMLLKYGPEDKSRDAVYRASQCGQDGRSASLTAPNGPAQEEIISRAIREARMTPPESTVWECHGTGTSLGDPIEVGAVRKVQIRMDRPEPLMMSTSKSNIGHLEGGAAMAGMIKCVLQAMHTQCFSSLHLRQLNAHLEHSAFDAFFESECSCFKFQQGHTQVSSFGFGGTNGHVIFWGRNMRRVPNIKQQIMARINRMAPPEVRPIGDNPDEWEADMPDADAKPGDRYFIEFNPEAPLDAPIRWVKDEFGRSTLEDDEDAFYAITGNFNSWQEDKMTPGTINGQHVVIVKVPTGGTLEFRFLKDGDSEKVICPEIPNCTRKSVPIVGPDAGLTNSWIIQAAPQTEIQIELIFLRGRYSVVWFRS